MISFKYYNPVKILFGVNSFNRLEEFLKSREVCLITSPGAEKRGWIQKVRKIANKLRVVIDDVEPNPSFKYLASAYSRAHNHSFDTIIAMGGGSVIDTAKALSVYPKNGERSFDFILEILRGEREKTGYGIIPLLAIPTTAGTGSEVTPWATLWDMENRKKHSLHLPDLWAKRCICDPALTLSLPKNLTIQTGLDALSHSLEALWNKNRNPVSTTLAIRAARVIFEILPTVVENPDDVRLREKMMLSSLMAGLAFSNTKTAAAHAISYYLTANRDVPHGIACSFTLPRIIEKITGKDKMVDSSLIEIFGEPPAFNLRQMFKILGVSTDFKSYNVNDLEMEELRKSLIENPRAGNFLFDVSEIF